MICLKLYYFYLVRFDWDRDRSEWLAKERLEARVGRRQIKTSTTNIDLDPLEKAGSVVLRTRLVEEVEQAQYLEREVCLPYSKLFKIISLQVCNYLTDLLNCSLYRYNKNTLKLILDCNFDWGCDERNFF